MPWAVTLPDGTTARTDHLVVGAVVDIAKELDTTWVHVTDFTSAGNGEVMFAVYKRMCADAGCDVPDDLTMTRLADLFSKVDDDLPTEFDEGNPPPGDAPETH